MRNSFAQFYAFIADRRRAVNPRSPRESNTVLGLGAVRRQRFCLKVEKGRVGYAPPVGESGSEHLTGICALAKTMWVAGFF